MSFRSNRAGPHFQLFWQAADGTGTVEQLTTDAADHTATGFADSNQLLFTELGRNGTNDVAMMTMDKRLRTPLTATPFVERGAVVSPDGRFMAYESSESGDAQIFVTPYPDVNSARWPISNTGGIRPAWSSDGKELFYERLVTGQSASELYATTVVTQPAFSRGNPVKLFNILGILGTPTGRTWDVSRDGKRFISIKSEASTAPPTPGADRPSFVFIVNWVEELKTKLGVNR